MSGAACSVFAFMVVGQSAKAPVPAAHPEAMSSEKAMELAEQGHCKEAMRTLKRTLAGGVDGEQRKRAGLLAVRCAMTAGDLANAEEFSGFVHSGRNGAAGIGLARGDREVFGSGETGCEFW